MFEIFLKAVERLRLPKNQFAIFGSGPLSIRNLREANDIDLIVKEELWNELSKKYSVTETKLIKIGETEIYKDWKPWFNDVNILIDSADIINNYRFVKLEYLIKWKKAMNREKDKTDIKIINDFLA
jgi:hypothetical protein